MGEWAGSGRDVFVYFNNDGHGHAVRNAARLRELVGAADEGRGRRRQVGSAPAHVVAPSAGQELRPGLRQQRGVHRGVHLRGERGVAVAAGDDGVDHRWDDAGVHGEHERAAGAEEPDRALPGRHRLRPRVASPTSSVMTTPSKPSCWRSRSVMTTGENAASVAGSIGV